MMHGMWKKLMTSMLCISLSCCIGAADCLAEETESTAETIITASDYSDENNWLVIPEITKEVDTFYIYPTAYFDTSEGAPDVCDIDSEILRTGAVDSYAQQGTAYEAGTNVFAPYYRQMNMAVAATAPAEVREALLQREPKADLFAALDYYFENLNEGRPFILAGHSQGSQMMTYVLSEYMGEHPEYYERMVAAYALGYSITDRYLEENPHLKFAEGEDDPGVIISWNTEGEGNADAENFVVEDGAIAINPLNWKRDETYAGKEECLGAYIQNAETGEFEIIPEAADAQLNTTRGVVVTHTDVLEPMDPSLGFGPDSYHGGDYSLWYTNIEANVETRIQAWFVEEAITLFENEDYAASDSGTAYAGEVVTESVSEEPTTKSVDQMTTAELYQAGGDAYDQEDYGKAIEYYKLAADQGDAGAQIDLGDLYYFGDGVEQSYEKAVEYYIPAAEQGSSEAQYYLGYMYFHGEGVDQSYEKAMEYYTLAAEQGYPKALLKLGDMYLVGEGVDQSYEKAMEYYKLAAEQDVPEANISLGDLYYYGDGVEQSYEKALEYYTLAADQGNADAMFNLALMYENGQGAEKSPEKTIKYYTLAVDQGNTAAMVNLAFLYCEGKSVEQSYEKALELYTLAAEQGEAGAYNNIGDMYEKGQGVEQSYEKAVEYYQLAIDQGSDWGSYSMGKLYEDGNGVEQSYEKAADYYRAAAEAGNEQAEDDLKRLYEEGKIEELPEIR